MDTNFILRIPLVKQSILLYKQQINETWHFLEDFRALSEGFLKIFGRRLSEAHTNISDHFPKNSEDIQKLPEVTKYFRAVIEVSWII